MITDEQFAALTKRVTVLEKASINNTETITWMAGTLGQMKSTLDTHTTRLNAMDDRLDSIDERLDRVEAKVDDLKETLPGIVATAMREVLRERG